MSELLPDEIFLLIVEYFSDHDIFAYQTVCKRWNQLLKDNTLWKQLCKRRWGREVEELQLPSWRTYYEERHKFDKLPPMSVRMPQHGSYQFEVPNKFLAQGTYEEGLKLFQSGDVTQAILMLEAAVQRHPMDGKAWALLGKSHAENDQDNEALQCLIVAHRINPTDKEILLSLAVSSVNEQENAIFFLIQWLLNSQYSDLIPTDDKLRKLVEQSQEPSTGKATTAPLATTTLLSSTFDDSPLPTSFTDVLPTSTSSVPADDWTLATATDVPEWTRDTWGDDWERMIKDWQRDEGSVLRKSPEQEEAAQSLQAKLKEAEARNPQDPNLPQLEAILVLINDQFTTALPLFEAALKLDPSNYSLWNRLGATRANCMQSEEALTAYTQALQRRPRYVRCLVNAGIAHANLHNYRESISCFIHALRFNPNASHVWGYMKMQMIAEPDLQTLSYVESKNLEGLMSRCYFSVPGIFTDSGLEAQIATVKENAPEKMLQSTFFKKQEDKQKLSVDDLLQMIKEGKTPADVRIIDDKPPNPEAPIPKGERTRPLKPWEKKAQQASSKPQVSASPAPTPVVEAKPYKSTLLSKNDWLPMFTVDAFTSEAFGGNPAAICLLTGPLEVPQMAHIAREMNLSETAFVYPLPEKGTEGSGVSSLTFKNTSRFKLRWFTPTNEVALCGHATLATAHVLFHELGLSVPALTFDTLSGDLVVTKSPQFEIDGGLCMDFPRGNPEPTTLPRRNWEALLSAMQLKEEDVVYEGGEGGESGVLCPVVRICRTTKKLLVELASVDKVTEIKPNLEALLKIDFPPEIPVRGVMATTRGGKSDGDLASSELYGNFHFVSRYFSPWNGIGEDPVTGSAHTALAVYWAGKLGVTEFKAYQASARGGVLGIRLTEGGRVVLQGNAVTVMGGRLRAI